MKRLPACLSLLVFLPAAAIAQTGAEYEYGSQQGNFDVTLGGSGTNDKAGSQLNLLRWVSPRAMKENLDPPTSFEYPFMNEK